MGEDGREGIRGAVRRGGRRVMGDGREGTRGERHFFCRVIRNLSFLFPTPRNASVFASVSLTRYSVRVNYDAGAQLCTHLYGLGNVCYLGMGHTGCSCPLYIQTYSYTLLEADGYLKF